MGTRYQVNYDKVFIEGALKGRRYHCHSNFSTRNDAKHFSMRDGLIITPVDNSPAFRQEDSTIIDLNQYEAKP